MKSQTLKTVITDIPLELHIEILEWLPLIDAMSFCNSLGLPQSLSFQHHQFIFDKNGRFKWNCQVINSMVERNSDFFDSLCQNRRFNKIFNIQDKLMIACELGYYNQIKSLMDDTRLDPGAEDNRAIRICCAAGHAEIVKLLMTDTRVDPSAMHNFPLLVASLNGFPDVVKLLLEDKRVTSVSRNNAVVVAASHQGHADVVKILLSDKVEYCHSTLTEAMKSAHSRGHKEVVALLANYLGLDPNNITL